MLKKALLVGLVISLIYILGAVSMAAPERLPSDYKGTSDELIEVTKPRDNLNTLGNVPVSVIGNEGTAVTFYVKDPKDPDYFVINPEVQYTKRIGASGLYVTSLPINAGLNYIGIFAELNGRDQFVVRRVNKANGSLRDSIRSILIRDIRDVLKTMSAN